MNPVEKILKRFSLHTLKIDILTIFLTLIVASFSCVIIYSYYKNYNSISDFAKGVMERNSNNIVERIRNLAIEAEKTLQDTSAVFLSEKEIRVQNLPVVDFMLHSLKFNGDISALFLGVKGGDLIYVSNIALTAQTHYVSKPDKSLPSNVVYLAKLTDFSKNTESFLYKDKNFKTIATEYLYKIPFDPRTRPWYIGAAKNNDFYWTDVYSFMVTGELGISVSQAIHRNNSLIGVFGADVSFVSLAHYFSRQKIGKNGKVFLLNQSGQILIPSDNQLAQSIIPANAVLDAFHLYKNGAGDNFDFIYDNVKYLAYIKKMPENFNQNWFVVIVVPFFDFFSDLIQTQFEIFLISVVILLLSILLIIYFSKRISKPIVTLSKEIDKITNLDLSSKNRVHTHIIEIYRMEKSIIILRNTLKSFTKYIPKEVVKHLLHIGKEIDLHLEKKYLTILFTDIKDFTNMVETQSLDKLLPLLFEYFDRLSKIILENNGTIDKYIGDSIMAFWGAPLELEDHAYFACVSALRCQNFLNAFNERRRQEGNPEFYTRFGIHSGEVLVGNIGSAERMNYTILGDAVNLASRLEGIGKVYDSPIIISEAVFQLIKDRFLVRPLDIVEVKGKKIQTKIYELVALIQADSEITANSKQIELCVEFSKAYEIFVAQDYHHALSLFTSLQTKFPNDYPTDFYIKRIRQKLGL